MGNHCIDCEFCGQDQRLVGNRCCEKYIEQQQAKEDAHKAKRKEQWTFLAKFGIKRSYDDDRLHIDDVVDALKRHDKRLSI